MAGLVTNAIQEMESGRSQIEGQPELQNSKQVCITVRLFQNEKRKSGKALRVNEVLCLLNLNCNIKKTPQKQ